jgi:DNA-binding transcriptional LysR family regulator
VCILPPDHRLVARSHVEAADLEGEEFISFDPADANRVAVDKAFREADVRRRLTVEAPYAAVVAGLVAQGVGVSVVNPITVIDTRPEVLAVRPFSPAIPFGFSLLYRKDLPLSLTARAFLATARAEFTDLFGADGLHAPP